MEVGGASKRQWQVFSTDLALSFTQKNSKTVTKVASICKKDEGNVGQVLTYYF